MGIYINAFWEIKIDGQWHTYSKPNFKQDYELFAKMAGVVNIPGIDPIVPPRGLPEDVSRVVKTEAEAFKKDSFAHSWLTAEEIEELHKFHASLYRKDGKKLFLLNSEEWGYLCGHGWESFRKYRVYYPERIEDIRLVFWFM